MISSVPAFRAAIVELLGQSPLTVRLAAGILFSLTLSLLLLFPGALQASGERS